MADGHPPTTFVYGIGPPPRPDEPKYILPVMPRPTPDPMTELIRRIQEMQNQPKYSDLIEKIGALEKFVTGWAADISKRLDALAGRDLAITQRLDALVNAMTEHMAALEPVIAAAKRKRKPSASKRKQREWRGQPARRNRSAR